jgi:hypothetical protein
MNNIFLWEGVVAEHKMSHEDQSLILTESTVFIASKVSLKIAIITVLQHQIEILLVSKAIIKFDDKWTRQGL